MSIYNRKGEPIAMDEYVRLKVEDSNYYRVNKTETVDGGFVSTVWLGFDHGYHGHLQIFESMKFPEQGPCWRYATESEAVAGHLNMVDVCNRLHKEKKS